MPHPSSFKIPVKNSATLSVVRWYAAYVGGRIKSLFLPSNIKVAWAWGRGTATTIIDLASGRVSGTLKT
jgi:hypothetical protein